MLRLNVQSRGIIKSGYLEYEFGATSITYRGEVTAKVLFFSKTVPFGGVYPLQRPITADLIVAGVTILFGEVTMTVMEVVAGIAKVNLSMSSIGAGVGYLDIKDGTIKIQSVDLKGRVAGYNIEVVAA